MAFVTYGLSDTRPTPLLTKRFFVPLQTVHKEIREQASNLGIGQTSSGGGRGMAALEGLVAAVEVGRLVLKHICLSIIYSVDFRCSMSCTNPQKLRLHRRIKPMIPNGRAHKLCLTYCMSLHRRLMIPRSHYGIIRQH